MKKGERSLGQKFRSKDLSRRLVRGIVHALGVQVVGIGLQYGLQVLFARWMGAAEYGLYVYAVTWGSVFSVVVGLGLPRAVLRLVPEYEQEGNGGRLRGLERGAWAGILLASLAALPVAAVLVLGSPAAAGGGRTALLLGLGLIPLFTLNNLYAAMLQAVRRIGASYTPMRVVRPILVIAGGFVIWKVGGRLTGVAAIAVALAAQTVTLAVLVGWWRRHRPSVARSAPPEYTPAAWGRIGIPLLLSGGCMVLVNQVDLLLLGWFAPPEDVGVFSAALRVSGLVGFVFMIVNAAAAPYLVSLHARGDHAQLQRFVRRVVHGMFWPSLGLGLLVVGLAGPILSVFGAAFTAGRAEVTVLVAAHVLNAATGPVAYLLDLTGHERRSLRIYAAGVVVVVVLDVLLIPIFGTMAAACVRALVLGGMNVALCVLVRRHLHVRASVLPVLRQGHDVALR